MKLGSTKATKLLKEGHTLTRIHYDLEDVFYETDENNPEGPMIEVPKRTYYYIRLVRWKVIKDMCFMNEVDYDVPISLKDLVTNDWFLKEEQPNESLEKVGE